MKSFLNPFTAIAAGITLGFAGVSALGVHAVTAKLERAASIQCERQDWPASHHTAMSEWCREFEATRAIYGRY